MINPRVFEFFLEESFALSDPLIQWEAIAHHPDFDANVNAIQAAEGVQEGLRA